ncbi:acyl carrier protein [bacterium]|nr:acyl carrier protein [bacterium]
MSAKERLLTIIAEQLGLSEDEISADLAFSKDLGADNLDKIEIILAVEEEFDIEIPNEEVNKLEKVEDLLNYLGSGLQ